MVKRRKIADNNEAMVLLGVFEAMTLPNRNEPGNRRCSW